MSEATNYGSARGAGTGYVGFDEPAAGPDLDEHGAFAAARLVLENIEALIDDGHAYLDAELSYQKTRASFVSDRAKKAVAFALAAGVISLLAAIGLVVGLIIALTPHLTGWGATALVVGLLSLVALVLLRRAAKNWRSMMGAVHPADEGRASDASRSEG